MKRIVTCLTLAACLSFPAAAEVCRTADLNGDGAVGFADFVAFSKCFEEGVAQGPVPVQTFELARIRFLGYPLQADYYGSLIVLSGNALLDCTVKAPATSYRLHAYGRFPSLSFQDSVATLAADDFEFTFIPKHPAQDRRAKITPPAPSRAPLPPSSSPDDQNPPR